MTVKSKPDGRKFRRFKGVGTRASYVVAYIDATASFKLKIRAYSGHLKFVANFVAKLKIKYTNYRPYTCCILHDMLSSGFCQYA